MSEQDIRDLLAWREPDWDALPHDAWTAEMHRATALAGAALEALHDGHRVRASEQQHPPRPLREVVQAIGGEVELERGGAWDGGRDRYFGAGPDDRAGLLAEFDELLGAMSEQR